MDVEKLILDGRGYRFKGVIAELPHQLPHPYKLSFFPITIK